MKHIILLLLLICLGCQKENHPKIEIYLLKHPVASTEGIPILDVNEFRDQHDLIKMDHLDSARFDTVNKQMIFAGKFIAKESDMQDKPFIKDDEIRHFEISRHMLSLDSMAVKRIENLKPSLRDGLQFVVTIDKKPTLFGYFRNKFSSYWIHTHWIHTRSGYYGTEKIKYSGSKSIYKYSFYLGYADYMPKEYKYERPPYNPKLIEAFRQSGRLIE